MKCVNSSAEVMKYLKCLSDFRKKRWSEEIGRRCWVDRVEGIWVTVCVCGVVWKAERGVPDGSWMPPPSRPWNQKPLPTRQPPAHQSWFSVCECVCVYVCGRGPLGKVQSCKVSPCSSSCYLLSLQPVHLSPPPPALHGTSCPFCMCVCITALLFSEANIHPYYL